MSVNDYKPRIQKCIVLAWFSQQAEPEAEPLHAAVLLECEGRDGGRWSMQGRPCSLLEKTSRPQRTARARTVSKLQVTAHA